MNLSVAGRRLREYRYLGPGNHTRRRGGSGLEVFTHEQTDHRVYVIKHYSEELTFDYRRYY